MDTNYIIETKNLTKQYGSQKSVADLNIHVKRGRIYGLLGRNGAGKTTTMKMLLGLTKPTSGEVKIWGKSLQGNEKKLLPRIGSLIESPGFYPNLTGTEIQSIFDGMIVWYAPQGSKDTQVLCAGQIGIKTRGLNQTANAGEQLLFIPLQRLSPDFDLPGSRLR